MRLAVVGEDRQKKDGVGVEMQSLQVVMAEDGEEELRERRHQARSNGAYEERIEGAPSALKGGRADLEHLRPVDALRRRHPVQLGETRLRHVGRVQSRREPSFSRGLARRHGYLGQADGTDLEAWRKRGEAQERGSEQRLKKEKSKAGADATPLITRAVAEAPTSNQPPRGAQGRRLLGPAALRPCSFAPRHGQVHARLGPGGYCRRSGNRGPQTCLPAACGVAQTGAQRGPSSSTQGSRPSRGAEPREADDMALPRARPPQAGSRGGGEIKAGTSRGAHDASHDDQGCQAGANLRSVSLSSLVQRGQAQARGSSKGTHFGATRPRPVQRWEGGNHGAQDGVTTGPLAGEDQL